MATDWQPSPADGNRLASITSLWQQTDNHHQLMATDWQPSPADGNRLAFVFFKDLICVHLNVVLLVRLIWL
ncbi:hypothetical protein DPMN_167980 [Dreissena polymorpha]|uniref:Uncharacterized protein n=1 Tax=Dreissena polymorpha TaxID=45954 RepID=A0A9D4F0W2_DREPO|nr:hypothetical protein DPMN_167980 [Dreissena polymorpha]